MSLTVGSLFCGIGGFDLAAERVDWRVTWANDNEPFVSAWYRALFPHVRYVEADVSMLSGPYGEGRVHHVDRVDVMCGGFPMPGPKHREPEGERAGR